LKALPLLPGFANELGLVCKQLALPAGFPSFGNDAAANASGSGGGGGGGTPGGCSNTCGGAGGDGSVAAAGALPQVPAEKSKATAVGVLGLASIDGAVTYAEYVHIRSTLARSDLAMLEGDNPAEHLALSTNKQCFRCPVKFGLFRWPKVCNICQMKVCNNCYVKMDHIMILGAPNDIAIIACHGCKRYIGGIL
jgi:hypothetical protein